MGRVLEVLQHLFVVWLVVAEPWWGRRIYKSLLSPTVAEPGFRASRYRRTIIWQ